MGYFALQNYIKMSLKTFVKIGKIDNLSDARYCAGMMVDILGFNLDEGTEGYVSPENFKEISDWVAGVAFCGEFTNAQVSDVKLASTQYSLDYIQVSNSDLLEELSSLNIKLILKLTIDTEIQLDQLTNTIDLAKDFVEYLIINSSDISLYPKINQSLSSLNSDLPIINGFEINDNNALEIAENNIYQGIELEGTPEERPGFKDYGMIMDVLELLEED